MRFSVATSLLAMIVASEKARANHYATCHVKPDPHYRTWDGTHYDYHGTCDAVLIKNPMFDGTCDMFDLHLRTKDLGNWGGITHAVLRIGHDKLEVKDDGTYIFSGGPITGVSTMGGLGYNVTYVPGSGSSSTVWEVDLERDQYVRFTNYNYGTTASPSGSISVEVYASANHFNTSSGMCGTWGNPGLIDRMGNTVADGNAMGTDWQVIYPDPDPQLFSSLGLIVPPTTCTTPPPKSTGQDEPGANNNAERECQHLEGQDFNNCVFDVTVTKNDKWAKAPLYHKFKCESTNNICKKKKGKCVERTECDDDNYHCVSRLCHWDKSTSNLAWLDKLDEAKDGRAHVKPFDPCVCAIKKKFTSGLCCRYKGPPAPADNCAAYELLPSGADYDGRCNQANQGASCEWNYNDPDCCEIAMNDANCKLPNDEAVEACECALNKKKEGTLTLQATSSLRAVAQIGN